MTIVKDQTHGNHSPVSRELHTEMNDALSEAKRLRRRIRRLLASARGSSERASEIQIMLVRKNPAPALVLSS